MQYTVVLLLAFMLGVAPMVMPAAELIPAVDVVAEATEVAEVTEEIADVAEVTEETTDVAEVTEVAEIAEVVEETPAPSPTVDGVEWAARYEALWLTRHDVPITFTDPALLVDWADAFNLAFGHMVDAISIEIYQEFTVLDEHWLEINLYQNDVPALKIEEYEALFFDAMEVGVLLERDTMTVGQLNGLMSSIREQFGHFQEPDAETTNATYYYTDDIYVSLWYDADNRVMRGRLCFE